MQSLCTLRDHCRQWPRNTRYQADATPYLGRTSTGWIAPALPGALIRSPRRRGPVESDLSMKIKTHFVFASTVWGRRTRFVRLRLCLKPTLASWPLVREFAARFDPAGVVAAVSTRESIGDARAYRDLA